MPCDVESLRARYSIQTVFKILNVAWCAHFQICNLPSKIKVLGFFSTFTLIPIFYGVFVFADLIESWGMGKQETFLAIRNSPLAGGNVDTFPRTSDILAL